jgi:8-oxo-dGTP diphosphatase
MGQKDQGLRSGEKRYKTIPRVLVFLRNGPDLLLIKGASDKTIWANLFNGVGGHVEIDEDVLTAARREVREETGIHAPNLSLKAVVNIDAGEQDLGILIFVFVGWSDARATRSSDEGALHWIPANQLPKEQLVEDLVWLIPRILEIAQDDPPLFLHYSYDSDDKLVIREANHLI